MRKPYVIYSPHYDYTSGGIKVMWGLYGWLLAKGVEVYMNEWPNDREVIAIYPEIVRGNPVGASTVVRYILNKPGVMAAQGIPGPRLSEYNPLDKLYYFSRLFGDGPNYMFLPVIDLHTFKDLGKKRDKKLVFVGKGTDKHLHPDDAIYIDRSTARDQSKLAGLLNESLVLYGYDPVSAMYECARLCGCRVVLLQDEYTWEEWEKYEPGNQGIYQLNQEPNIVHDKHYPEELAKFFRDTYKRLIKEFETKLDQFIEEVK